MRSMEDQGQGSNSHSRSHSSASETTNEPVRSRWTPKPEQILILESIFNSGMVNPPKEETVKIRKLLEKFGAVGDANVFYWFQNRRSRSRRRQRQMQASLEQRNQLMSQQQQTSGGAIQYESGSSTANIAASVGLDSSSLCFHSSPPFCLAGSSSTCGVMSGQEGRVDSLFPVTAQLAFPEVNRAATSSVSYPDDVSNLHYQPGVITVFINGIPTEVPRGPLDTKTMFGEDVVLVYSSGVPVPTNGFHFLMQSLQHGESYFLVPRAS